ncbi:hypothetical protein J7M00_09610 [bacterium]|nr:hypothetical protein [bacterium]
MKNSFVFITSILTLQIFGNLYAIEGISPPRKPVRLKIEIEEDKRSFPSDFFKLFEESFKYFIHHDTTHSLILLSAFGGMNSIGGEGKYTSEKFNLYALGYKDTFTTSHSRAEGFSTFRTAIFQKFPLTLAASGIYERRNFSGWYPEFYCADFSGKFLVPAKKSLLSANFFTSGFERKFFPSYTDGKEGNELSSGIYREITGSFELRGYGFLAKNFGAFAQAGFSFARRGEELFPQSSHLVAAGVFLKKIPIVAKVGACGTKIRDEEKIDLRPSIELRLINYPITAVATYGIGIERNTANQHSIDATIDPSLLRIALVETIGVKIRYHRGKISAEAGGVYGKTSALPYISEDTTSWYFLKTDTGSIARAYGKISLLTKFYHIPIKNSLAVKIDRSRLENSHYAPLSPNMEIADTFEASLKEWLSVWGAFKYISGYYRGLRWKKWTEGNYYSSCGIDLKWRSVILAIEIDNITEKPVMDNPLFTHFKREIKATLKLQNTIKPR